ncbi:hypothetical protein HED48_03155 [Ochrobactrum intermedium]|nr:hypothetical protein [Brucella intermedia]
MSSMILSGTRRKTMPIPPIDQNRSMLCPITSFLTFRTTPAMLPSKSA